MAVVAAPKSLKDHTITHVSMETLQNNKINDKIVEFPKEEKEEEEREEEEEEEEE